MNRLGIFVFYDKDGIVDDYIPYMLADIRENFNELVIVCNGKLTKEEHNKLSRFTSRIHIRENSGFDAMAYKLALTEYCGWEEVYKYDSICLFNDTFFGPFYPFSEVFQKMEAKDLDFWGLSQDPNPNLHIQYYFVVIEKSMLQSEYFRKYWENFDSSKFTFSEVVEKHEWFFTKLFENYGFKWGTYIDIPKYISKIPQNNFVLYASLACDLIKYERFPVLKRKNFTTLPISWRTDDTGESLAKALDFIKNNTNYDVNMIWDNILRIYNINAIQNAMHLQYICSSKQTDYIINNCRIAIIVSLNHSEFRRECNEYLTRLPKNTDLKIIEDILPEKSIEIYGKELSENYDFICFVHDFASDLSKESALVGRLLISHYFENTMKSPEFIANAIQLFHIHERLGMLIPPPPLHSHYLGEFPDAHNAKPTVFWARAKALNSTKYYSAFVMSEEHASLRINNLQFMLKGILDRYNSKGWNITDYFSIEKYEMLDFAKRHKHIIIYGAGWSGKKVAEMLLENDLNFDYFAISDGQPKPKDISESKVLHWSELPFSHKETGIILAMEARHRKYVLPVLQSSYVAGIYIFGTSS